MSRRRNRDTLARKRPRLQPRARLLIVCEGRVTEPRYLRSLIAAMKTRLVEVEIVPEAGVPKTLVEYAVARKRNAEREARRTKDQNYLYDEVWCVFDVDQHPNLAEAKQQARDNRLWLSISNPNIELWGLLHFQDQFAFEQRARITHLLRRYVPDYVKEFPFETLFPQYAQALERARRLDEWHRNRGTTGENPSTGFYLLTERIRELGKDAQLQHLR